MLRLVLVRPVIIKILATPDNSPSIAVAAQKDYLLSFSGGVVGNFNAVIIDF